MKQQARDDRANSKIAITAARRASYDRSKDDINQARKVYRDSNREHINQVKHIVTMRTKKACYIGKYNTKETYLDYIK